MSEKPPAGPGEQPPTIVERLFSAGFDIAFTTMPGFARPGEAPLERSRFLVLSEVTPSELAHRMTYSWSR